MEVAEQSSHETPVNNGNEDRLGHTMAAGV